MRTTLFETTEIPTNMGDYDRVGLYTLRQATDKAEILKNERHEFFTVLRRAGVIKYNNEPTLLALLLNLFRGTEMEFDDNGNLRQSVHDKPILLTEKGAETIERIAKRTFFGYSRLYRADVDRFWIGDEVKKITSRGPGW